jgi:lipoate-protein ligase A
LRCMDLPKMFQLLKLKGASCTQAADIGKRKITSIENQLGHAPKPETIANALAQGFRAILKIQLEEGKLTQTELENADKLCKEKYTTKQWNLGKTA